MQSMKNTQPFICSIKLRNERSEDVIVLQIPEPFCAYTTTVLFLLVIISILCNRCSYSHLTWSYELGGSCFHTFHTNLLHVFTLISPTVRK